MSQTVTGKLKVQNTTGDTLVQANGDNAAVFAGGHDSHGSLALFAAKDTNGKPFTDTSNFGRATIHINGELGNIACGGNTTDGSLGLFPQNDKTGAAITSTTDFSKATIRAEAAKGTLRVGGAGTFGKLSVFGFDDTEDFFIQTGGGAFIQMGGHGGGAAISMLNKNGKQVIRLDGDQEDIFLSGADCAEDFDVASPSEVEPGMVMVIDECGSLRPSDRPYDRRVAGVISGAGNFRPGIVLGRSEKPGRVALALVGKVFCKVDATAVPVEVGDLITTSNLLGHAMKAADPLKSFGAVIGKALRPLRSGCDLIPILVALQ